MIRLRRLSLERKSPGFTLLELVITLGISSVLTLTLVQLALATRNSFRLQQALAELQENGRFFSDWVASALSDSGYHPKPWLSDTTPIGVMPDSMDNVTPHGDRLVVRSWSDRNCFQSINPVDALGNRVFYLKESIVELNKGNLAFTCRYGPDTSGLITQVNRQGSIPQVESFQVLYAVDTDHDKQADQWLNRNDWTEEQEILAIRLAIISHSTEPVSPAAEQQLAILDSRFAAPPDGRLRRIFSYSLPVVR